MRPRNVFLLFAAAAVGLFALASLYTPARRHGPFRPPRLAAPPASSSSLAAAAETTTTPPPEVCGDGICSASETWQSCFADCPGVTTPAACGEEPHSDIGGNVARGALFGMDPKAKAASAAECCERCRAHAADPAHAAQPCNSWAFCPLPICWGLDTGWNHTFGECWLKWQVRPEAPLYGQRGKYTDEYRRRHARVRGGPPTHVPWTGGVIGARPDRSLSWTTGPEGMRSSRGDELTNWRAWEAPGVYEKRLAQRQRQGKRASDGRQGGAGRR